MECPQCQFENPKGMKFCGRCGNGLHGFCPECDFFNPEGFLFCGKCGYRLGQDKAGIAAHSTPASPPDQTMIPEESERKQATVVFSDLSGYTAMTEKLDPEEVREIMGRIFEGISRIVAKYEGVIDKYIGDAIMALFGVPKSHEDDSLRAVNAAREIHEFVAALSPSVEEKTGRPLTMHTGINTGLVVTGSVETDKGLMGFVGDAINLASRFSGLAGDGEIIVGSDIYFKAQGFFNFQELEPTNVKGKSEPVRVYRVLSIKESPETKRRLCGVRADLVGREVEMEQLHDLAEGLYQGRGAVVSIVGDAGSGKSRLVEEYKSSLNLKEIQWREGHAYAYCQSMPYYPLIDLFSRALRIEEGDSQDKIREKVETGLTSLIGEQKELIPYIGSLFALNYQETEDVSPEFWKNRLQQAAQAVLGGLTDQGPTIICLEDLHWADISTIGLLRFLLSEFRYPALFLCVYRPTFNLVASHQSNPLVNYHEIRLQDLSPSETREMLASLLQAENVSSELRKFVQIKSEGNPFFLEELVNSLIESEMLIRDNGGWKLAGQLTEADVPSTIQDIISARLDRLEKENKRILQEASVIGRAFFHAILRSITEIKDQPDLRLMNLERLDLIRTKSLQPDIEYIFKHAMTQEVIYNGLLKKERRVIHERVARVMEQLFSDRLPEFYETLAFHFKQGQSLHKAVDYLMKSGEKSLARYAVEESHNYYQEAFDLLSGKPDKTKEENALLIDIIFKWAMVFYYRADFKTLNKLMVAHQGLAESLDDNARLGMFYTWMGWGLINRTGPKDGHQFLLKGLELGELSGNRRVIGYACTWLVWSCVGLGFLDEALDYCERAQEIYKNFEPDHYIYFKSLIGLAQFCFFLGDHKRAFEVGAALLDFGQKHSNVRSLVGGHALIAVGHQITGELPSAVLSYKKAVEVGIDPIFKEYSRLYFGLALLLDRRFEEAEVEFQLVIEFSRQFGFEAAEITANFFLGVIYIANGKMNLGMKMLEEGLKYKQENKVISTYALFQYVLGNVYLQLVQGEGPKSKLTLARNIGFLIKNVPKANRKAEEHLTRAHEVARDIGATLIQGQALLGLGVLHKTKGRTAMAGERFSEAIEVFTKCENEFYLKQSREELASLG